MASKMIQTTCFDLAPGAVRGDGGKRCTPALRFAWYALTRQVPAVKGQKKARTRKTVSSRCRTFDHKKLKASIRKRKIFKTPEILQDSNCRTEFSASRKGPNKTNPFKR